MKIISSNTNGSNAATPRIGNNRKHHNKLKRKRLARIAHLSRVENREGKK